MSSSVIGQPVTRIDGKLKVTGHAPYGTEHAIQNVAYGVAVASTIGNGRILSIDSAEAEKMPGVLAILHHGNVERLYRPAGSLEEMSRPGENRPPFEDEIVYYYGQFVALVVAETFEQAQDAASHVHVQYDAKRPLVRLDQAAIPNKPPDAQSSRGNAETAFQQAPVKLDATYVTPVETHNPMEMHGTIAVWEGDRLILYETSQGVVNHHNVASQVLGMPLESIHIISPFVGSGFGDKLFPWPHSWLAAVGAKQVKRPVKVAVPRTLMFTTVGHRPNIRQRVRLGATQDGKLVATMNDVLQHTSMVHDYLENCVDATSMLYSCANLNAVQHNVALNVGTPTPMRGPGRTPALFALESAMDELAVKLNIDPLELRICNYAEKDESSGKPWSSKHLREAYQQGADRFGWSKRNPKVGSMKKGKEFLGWGMATCTWPCHQAGADVRVRLLADGTAQASCATQDIGTGTYTVFAEIVSDKTGLPVDKVKVVLGDSSLPPGPTSGGSAATASVIPAIAKATQDAIEAVLKAAAKSPQGPFHDVDLKTLKMSQGRVHTADKPPDSGVPFQEILASQKLVGLDGFARTGRRHRSYPGDPGPEQQQDKYSIHSFGAHFCEISYDPEIVRLRVTRWLSVIDGGRMINQKTARNQILGAVVMGIGMGMLEETVYDARTGHPINNNFADYMVAVNADVPEIDVVFLDYPDTIINEYGARGIGEIGLTGCASALTSATYHATGVRVRELPIRIEKLLA
ncbi:MAG: Periplasmic aromatic aldehyde oxidoreductase, molybdenum binding subunit YagR [Acidobacteriaceae bacterium]|nr:Periplasmic aromatic aldehyde oxidoreductase, molybdenum binding subunit YagR [Acidobacteriaceae bacterium]